MAYSNSETSHRIFIGIPVDKCVQQAIERLLEAMQIRSRSLRWVPAKNLHMTLAFLGEIRPNEQKTVQQGFAAAYAGNRQFQYQLSALRRFPNSRGRIIALTGEASESLQGLATVTRDMLGERGLGFERKTFRPHITLARIRNPRQPIMKIDQQVDIRMEIRRVALYRSTLTESGSFYTVLENADLCQQDQVWL